MHGHVNIKFVTEIITGINLMPHGVINYNEIRRKFLSIV